MSNMVRSMEKRSHKMNMPTKPDLNTVNNQSKSINFQNKQLPNALYVHVKDGTFKLGDKYNTIAEQPVIFTVENTPEGAERLLNFLSLYDETTITRVIMDNDTDFKVRSLPELVADITNANASTTDHER